MSRGGGDAPKLKMEDIWVDIGAKIRKCLEACAVGDIIIAAR